MIARRHMRGAALFGALLAIGLLGTIFAAGSEWLADRLRHQQARLAGSQVTTLSDATATYVNSNFRALLAQVQGGSHELAVSTLRSANVLPTTFPTVGALGRDWRILLLPDGTTAIRVLVTEEVPTGDLRWPDAAKLGTEARLGIVWSDARLKGPLVDESIADFRTEFSGEPKDAALAVLERFDHESVYGDYLYRSAIPGLAAANTMETDLDLGGHDLSGAGEVSAATAEVTENVEIGGSLTVEKDLVVRQALTIEGDLTASGTSTVSGLDIDGRIAADSVNVVGAVSSETAVVTSSVEADSIATDSTFAASEVTVDTELRASAIEAPRMEITGTASASSATVTGTLTADSATVSGNATVAGDATAGSVYATSVLSAATAGIDQLTVGSCVGC